jgi:hypothetical protein
MFFVFMHYRGYVLQKPVTNDVLYSLFQERLLQKHYYRFISQYFMKFRSTNMKSVSPLSKKQAIFSKNGAFCDVTPCGSCKNRRYGGT